MASIVKRKSKYSVVYDYIDENGKRRQRWETFSTNAEAKKTKKSKLSMSRTLEPSLSLRQRP